jgi:multidrug resistance efflux pump
MKARVLLLLAALAAVATAGWLIARPRSQPLVVSGFVEADRARVGSRVGGRVAEVLVHEGERVDPGAVLYRLEPFDLETQLARAEAEAEAARASLQQMRDGFRPEEIAQAKADRDRAAAVLARKQTGARDAERQIARERVRQAEANLEIARIERDRVLPLRAGGGVSQTELDRAERELVSADAALAIARQDLALVEEGTRAEEIAEAAAQLAQAEAVLRLREAGTRGTEVAAAEAKLRAAEAGAASIRRRVEELVVRAPSSAVVEAIDLRAGDLVSPDAPTVNLLLTESLYVRAFVPEAQLDRVSLGMRVPIELDAMRGTRVEGVVTFISSQAEFTPRNVQTPEERSKQVFRVKLSLAGAPPQVRAGMLGDVRLDEAGR